tara:strand:- start:4923 stop:5120 length:198 start_codon:yes stop_codon:yes gene_type:complete
MSNVTVYELVSQQDNSIAGVISAEADWKHVGANENPYSPVSHPLAHKAYIDTFESLIEMERSIFA